MKEKITMLGKSMYMYVRKKENEYVAIMVHYPYVPERGHPEKDMV